MYLYRLTRRKFAGIDAFDGEGSRLFGGRWSSMGTRLCYTATHRSLAILEYRVNMDPSALPADLVIATLEVPEGIRIGKHPPLPERWREYPAPGSLRAIGDTFVRDGKLALMRVPSVIVPQEDNILLNPAHKDAARMLRQQELVAFTYDSRLI